MKVADYYLILQKLLKQKIEGVLVTMDTEKGFDSIDHNFLISALEKYGFGNNFISWVKILLRNQGPVFLMEVHLQSIFCLREAPIKVI